MDFPVGQKLRGDGAWMVGKAVLILLLIFFTSGGLSFAQEEWPEGWSREGSVAVFGDYSRDYSLLITGSGDRLVAGFEGSTVRNIRATLLRNGNEIYTSPTFFNAFQSELVVDERGGYHLFWVEREGSLQRILYTYIDGDGEIRQDSLILRESPSRIDGMTAVERVEGEIHLIWSDVERPEGVLLHMIIEEGQIVQDYQVLVKDPFRPTGSTFVFDREGYLHLFWRKIDDWEMNCYYQKFTPEGEAAGPADKLVKLTNLDGDRRPVIDAELKAFWDEEGQIYLIFSGQDQQAGMDNGHFSQIVLEKGRSPGEPMRISPSFQRLQSMDAIITPEALHLAWVHFQGNRYRPFYMKVSREGEIQYGPQVMDLTTSGGLNPRLARDNDSIHYFWQRTGSEVGTVDILARNDGNPQSPPLGYALGLGKRNPHLGFLYVLGVGFVYAALLTVFAKFLGPVAVYFILALANRLKLIGNLEKFPVHGALVIMAGLFLFQDTVLDFIHLEWSGRFFPLLAASLASAFALLMKKGEKRWLKLDNTMGWVFFMVLWLYWYTFLITVPNLIITS